MNDFIFSDLFQSVSDYEDAGVKFCTPMTAKELDSVEEQDSILNDESYYIEEKFDGTRGLLHFYSREGQIDLLDIPYKNLVKSIVDRLGSASALTSLYSTKLKKDIDLDYRISLLCDYLHAFPVSGIQDVHDGYIVTDSGLTILLSSLDQVLYDVFKKGGIYPTSGYTRCFSRRVSKNTGWFAENTDSLPHLKNLSIPELAGTIIDGELFIPNRPFKDVSATLNCKWDKAIERQEELGYIVFHAFDILYYKGIKVEKMPLWRRKELLQRVVDTVKSPFIEMVPYFSCGSKSCEVDLSRYSSFLRLMENPFSCFELYPNASKEFKEYTENPCLSPRAYYEAIVATGGEGVIVKPKNGQYFYKRGREYLKIKKFLTREVIIMGFTEPTKEYKGKFPKPEQWQYWETNEHDLIDTSDPEELDYVKHYLDECRPVSKFYFEGWVGNIRYGVRITDDEISKLPKSKKFNIQSMSLDGEKCKVVEVGDCSGFSDGMREKLSKDPELYVGKVIEVKANELFKDTGKLRHPRFLRFRLDKSPLSCTWGDHING